MENYDNSKKHKKFKIKSRNLVCPRLNSTFYCFILYILIIFNENLFYNTQNSMIEFFEKLKEI